MVIKDGETLPSTVQPTPAIVRSAPTCPTSTDTNFSVSAFPYKLHQTIQTFNLSAVLPAFEPCLNFKETVTVLRQLGIAMFLYKEEHDGNLPEVLDILTPYVELDTLEQRLGRPLEGNIMLLTRGIWVSPTEGKRIWALIKIPRSDGKYDVLYEPFDSLYPRLGVLSAEQLRAIGIEPNGAISSEGDKNLVESIWSSAKKTLGISLTEKRGAGSSSGAKWLYGVLGIALLCLLVIILRAKLRKA